MLFLFGKQLDIAIRKMDEDSVHQLPIYLRTWE